MKASRDITKIVLGEEFRICPQCGYELEDVKTLIYLQCIVIQGD